MRFIGSAIAATLMLAACVTVNVYFPAAAAERAADRLICEVYGVDCDNAADAAAPPESPDSAPGADDGAWLEAPARAAAFVGRALGNLLIPVAEAQQPDISISTPAINELERAMEARHPKLKAHYESGALGMNAKGLITLRDPTAVDLRSRNRVKALVAEENADRNRLYAEIAKANGHPEWEPNIRETFARRWVANAPAGWWYERAPGQWARK